MRVAKTDTGKFLRNSAGKILKLQPDAYIEPKPDVLMIQIEIDAGQVFTLPTINSFTYANTSNQNTASGTLVYNYVVDWGDGTAGAAITTYNSTDRIHTYAEAGTYVIEITGVFPCWDTNNDAQIRLLITRVISWGNTGLKKINFYGCAALTNLPEQQSKLITLLTASYFCFDCAGLTSIPYGTFFGCSNISDFSSSFRNCGKLRTIHSTTFNQCHNAYSFAYAFYGCIRLVLYDEQSALFTGCPKANNFYSTFYNCTSITKVPSGLFCHNNTTVCNYQYTFYQCTSLVEISPTVFANSSGLGNDFTYTFYYCTSLPSIPAGLFDNIKISNAVGIFHQNSSLTTIPEYLFRYQNLCTSFNSAFGYCYKLTGVPTGVFDLNVGGTNVCTQMNACFYQCGTQTNVTIFTVANNLFDQLNKVTTFDSTFYYCSKLEVIPTSIFDYCVAATSFAQTFSGTKISSIPSGLFQYCTEAVTFQSTFSGCGLLVSAGIPSNLFANCTKAQWFGYSNASVDQYSNYGTFSNCSNAGFTYIPSGLFDNCINAISFSGCFSGTKITSVPTDLLRYCTSVVNISYMFSSTNITATTANMFAYNRSITTVKGVFSGCLLLTTIDQDTFNTYNSNTNAITTFENAFAGCTNVALTSIPVGLFQYSINAKNFGYCFQNVPLTSIPDTLFSNNTIAESFSSCFSGTKITAIPATMLSGLTQIKSCDYMFYNCHELLSIPSGLFDSVGNSTSVTWSNCFRVQATTAAYNKITGAIPALWLKPNSPVGTQCFYNRTAVSNYADIPVGWK